VLLSEIEGVVGAVAHAAVRAAAGVPDQLLATRVDPVTDTFAVLLAPPNTPNTYPRIAASSMSVAAMMRTVATIGEIAFLCCPGIFIEPPSSPIILTVEEINYRFAIHIL
jgi:hypothetical protein